MEGLTATMHLFLWSDNSIIDVLRVRFIQTFFTDAWTACFTRPFLSSRGRRMELLCITSWEESVDALPDIPDPRGLPASSLLHTPFEYPLYRSRADNELEPVVVLNIELKVSSRYIAGR